MVTLFVVCATIGGTLLLCQLVLTLMGLGGDAFDLDVDGDVGADVDLDVDVDMDADTADHHGSSWIFGVISFRSVVAALTFFGLAGLTANSTGAEPPVVLLIALGAGAAAMYAIYRMMKALSQLGEDGTVKIRDAVDKQCTVYLRIPAERAGAGKVHLNLQGRTMEYTAVTEGRLLAAGEQVVVVNIVTTDTLEVQALSLQEGNAS